MPFGLYNTPVTFQTIINEALRLFLGKFVIVYLNDVLIYSKSREEYYEYLKKVFKVL